MFKAPSSEQPAKFYDRLMDGTETLGMLGKDTRYNPHRVAALPSVRRFFVEVVKPLIHPSDRVLDFGCGPGSFLLCTAPLCREVVGVDISEEFVHRTRQAMAESGVTNGQALHTEPLHLPLADGCFDVLLMVDVVHHLENIHPTMQEAFRVLKPGGQVIIFEPNKLNPVVYLLHLFDRNERGLLALGTPAKYRRIFARYMTEVAVDFNGIVIGPQSRFWTVSSAVMNASMLRPLLGWLNPKMVITGKKISDAAVRPNS